MFKLLSKIKQLTRHDPFYTKTLKKQHFEHIDKLVLENLLKANKQNSFKQKLIFQNLQYSK